MSFKAQVTNVTYSKINQTWTVYFSNGEILHTKFEWIINIINRNAYRTMWVKKTRMYVNNQEYIKQIFAV